MSLYYKTNRKLAAWGLIPRTRMARLTACLAVVELALALLWWVLVKTRGYVPATLAGWTNFLGVVLALFFFILFVRWFRNYVMWRLRNRLIVTYLFIGGVPVLLVVLMGLISSGFLTSKFATYLTVSEIRTQIQRLEATNAATALDIAKNNAKPAATKGDELFPQREVFVWTAADRPKWLKESFSGLVWDDGNLYLRAVNVVGEGPKRLTVVSSVPVDRSFLSQIAGKLGPLTLYFSEKSIPGKREDIQVGGNQGVLIGGARAKTISAGSLPPPRAVWDRALGYYDIIPQTDWHTGESGAAWLDGTTRISTLFSQLAVSSSQWTEVLGVVLLALAVLFGLIVIFALFIGIRLTRTITVSVANLYEATQYINRGDFTHRIKVKDKDQLAALQVAFNSMTGSLEKLIAEQKEKERLQSELEIAHEVQAQLFPRAKFSTATLELHGVCLPARIVSGDYYDFLPCGLDQLGIALGDISGKGISAALLMATIHSAVRVYEQEHFVAEEMVRAGHKKPSATALVPRRPAPSPAKMLYALNRHLYHSTQPEKYATLFLGFYDGATNRITYSNAGHLPPLILGRDRSVQRLHMGGTVVGLFDEIQYDQQTVDFNPGDIFIAFSDGITEPENEFGEFGEERLLETVSAHHHLPLVRITDHVIATVQDWIGSTEQPDDITLVLARRLE